MNNLPQNLKISVELDAWSIMLAYRGSIAHNLYKPNNEPNSIDDIDLMSIVIPPKDYYYGLKQFGSRDTKEVKQDEWDIVCYEVKKFVSLLAKGNPNVIGMLYLNDEHYISLRPEAELLIENRELFNSQRVYHSFLGYSKAQFYKMSHLAFEGYMGEKRKRLVKKFGYDTKNAAHLIRLMTMCNEWLVDRQFKVYRDQDRDYLLDIKNGKYSLAEVQNQAMHLFTEGESRFAAYKKDIPEDVDYDKINELLLNVFETHYEYY